MRIGIDIVEVSRIKRLRALYGKRFLARIFTDDEIEYCLAQRKGVDQCFAGRFALKEAFIKAYKEKISSFKRIEICKKEDGGTYLKLDGKVLDNAIVSLSHEREYAVGVCILLNEGGYR